MLSITLADHFTLPILNATQWPDPGPNPGTLLQAQASKRFPEISSLSLSLKI